MMRAVQRQFRLLDGAGQDAGEIRAVLSHRTSEETAEDGSIRMVKNTLLIPEGKRPLVFSYDDVNYYQYMIETGFTHKLILGRRR